MQSARHFCYKYFKQIKEPLGQIPFHFLAGFHRPYPLNGRNRTFAFHLNQKYTQIVLQDCRR
ncbi:MAG: hypothetical protein ACJ73C_02270, partial [Nitrososphaeraceae archaeon]